jgi:hypothetical protein
MAELLGAHYFGNRIIAQQDGAEEVQVRTFTPAPASLAQRAAGGGLSGFTAALAMRQGVLCRGIPHCPVCEGLVAVWLGRPAGQLALGPEGIPPERALRKVAASYWRDCVMGRAPARSSTSGWPPAWRDASPWPSFLMIAALCGPMTGVGASLAAADGKLVATGRVQRGTRARARGSQGWNVLPKLEESLGSRAT